MWYNISIPQGPHIIHTVMQMYIKKQVIILCFLVHKHECTHSAEPLSQVWFGKQECHWQENMITAVDNIWL